VREPDPWELLENLNISANSKPNKKIVCERIRGLIDGKKQKWKITDF
jgi:hypothetical protein